MKGKALFSFAGSSIVLGVAQLISNILVLRWISPGEIGIWNTVVVLSSYATVLNLGVTNGLSRELPFLLGRKNARFARSVAGTTLFVSLVAACLAIMGFSIWALNVDKREVGFSLFTVGILSAASFISMYFSTTFRTNKAFLAHSKINGYMVVVVFATLVLPVFNGFYGFLQRLVLIEIFRILFYIKYQPFPVVPMFRWLSFKFLLITGIPLFVGTYLSAISETFKRVILVSVSSFEVVGLFAPALAVYALNSLLPKALGRYIFPKINYGIGQGKTLRDLWVKNIMFSLVAMAMMAPVALLGWFMIPPFIMMMFPQYMEGSYAAQIALVSGLFMPFSMLMNFFHATKKWVLIYLLVVIKIVVFFTLQWIFVRIMEPLDGIAYGTLVGQIVYAVVIVFMGYWHIRRSSKIKDS